MTEPEKLALRSHDSAGDKIAGLLRLFPETGWGDFEGATVREFKTKTWKDVDFLPQDSLTHFEP